MEWNDLKTFLIQRIGCEALRKGPLLVALRCLDLNSRSRQEEVRSSQVWWGFPHKTWARPGSAAISADSLDSSVFTELVSLDPVERHLCHFYKHLLASATLAAKKQPACVDQFGKADKDVRPSIRKHLPTTSYATVTAAAATDCLSLRERWCYHAMQPKLAVKHIYSI